MYGEIMQYPFNGIFFIYLLPNIITIPLMMTETFNLPEIAKQDRLVQTIDKMLSWILMIFPLFQITYFMALVFESEFNYWLSYAYNSNYLQWCTTLNHYALPILIATDIFTPVMHTIKVYSYAFL
ncbi:hypothetical protein FGO68_gene12505 [Halteria grandinella]|uniref:Uncharacterized protein n=1 Tax=Halteria grandinella TaxID=5974 RepID=A0A8J8NJB4_HALGN|nr:hypothetical protein FGO68_gene12505 [Halteria grandinella]